MGKIRKVLMSMLFVFAMVLTAMPVQEVSAASNTLPEAVGGVITLTEDVNLSSTFTVAKNETLKIDLNGYTITGVDSNTTGNFGLIDNYGTLTVMDSSVEKDGKITLSAITNRNWNNYSTVIANLQGTLIIDGGTIEHTGGTAMAYAIDNNTNGNGGDAKTTVNGGTISSTYRAIRQFANSQTCLNELVINGGAISGNNKGVWLQSANTKSNKANLDINDDNNPEVSSVYVYAPANGNISELSVSIEPETVTDNAITAYLGDYVNTIAPGQDGVLTITEANVIQVGEEVYTYARLNEAINEINSGKNAKLLTHLELTDSIIITGNTVLDLNEYEIYDSTDATVYPLIRIQNNAEVTIKNGTVFNDKDYAIVLGASDGSSAGNLTIESGNYYGETTVVSVTKGLLTINDGYFEAEKYGEDYRYTINCVDANHTAETAKVVINGGSFYNWNPHNNASEGENTRYTPSGYTANYDSTTGKYTTVKVNSAAVTTEAELREAMAVGGEITLTANVELTEGLVVPAGKDVVLNLNGKTISTKNTDWTSTAAIKVEGTLEINGEGTIDSSNPNWDYSIAVWARNGGIVTINGGNFTNTGAKETEDDGDANNNELIYASGSNSKITINDGTFSGTDYLNEDYPKFMLNLEDRSTSTIIVNGGSFIDFDPSNTETEPTDVQITSFVASGLIAELNGNTFVIVVDPATIPEEPKSTVEFVVDGKVWRTYRVTKGADIRMPEVPEKEGYVGEWDHDGENIRTATTITAVYTKVEEPVNNTDLSDYADFQLPVYTNSRVTNIATANGSITVDGYMFKANANLDNENSIWREIIFVNEEDYSMAKAYRKQVTPVYNTWLNKNLTATANGTYKLDYANYTVNFSNTDINNYVGNTPATKMASGSYLAYMRISDGTDSYLFPLKDIVLSDGSTLALPNGFEVVDTTTRALRYIVK